MRNTSCSIVLYQYINKYCFRNWNWSQRNFHISHRLWIKMLKQKRHQVECWIVSQCWARRAGEKWVMMCWRPQYFQSPSSSELIWIVASQWREGGRGWSDCSWRVGPGLPSSRERDNIIRTNKLTRIQWTTLTTLTKLYWGISCFTSAMY